MKRILFFLLALLLTIAASAQNMPRRQDLQPINAKGYEWLTGSFKNGLYFPQDTLQSADSGAAAIVKGVMYLKNVRQGSSIYWGQLGGSIETENSITGAGTSGNRVKLVNDLSATPAQGDRYYYGWDSAGILGYQKDKYVVAKTYSELRKLRQADTTLIYRAIINKQVADFYWDENSTMADDSVVCIKLDGVATGRLIRYYEDYVLVNWWPVKADGFTDDSYYWQKAIDFTIAHGKVAKLKCLSGIYVVKNLLIHKDSDNNGQYEFVTLAIEGAAPTHDINLSIGAITVLKVNDPDAFGLGVQIGRNCEIRNISFTGPMTTPNGLKQVIEWQLSDWLTGGIRNNRYSPNAGFVVDPINAAVAPADRYPGVPYTHASASGTSECAIIGCTFRNFNVGIMISPNGVTQNCDNITFTNGNQFSNRIFWGSGQNQSRGNHINNLYSIGGTQFLINCNEFGMNQGTPPSLINSNIAGGVKHLYLMNGGFSGLNIKDTYMEGVFSFGVSGDLPVTFEGVQITMARPDAFDCFVSPQIAQGRQLNYFGGSLEWFDNYGVAGFQLNCEQANFKGATIRGGVPTNAFHKEGRVHFDGVQFLNNSNSSMLWESQHEFEANISYINSSCIIPGMVFKTQNGFDETGKFTIQSVDNKIDFIKLDVNKTLDIDTVTHSAKLVTSNSELYQIGDCLFSREVAIYYSNSIFSGSVAPLGWVSNIVADSVYISYVPYGLQEGVNYNVFINRIPRAINRTLGDVTSGSTTITNVQTSDGVTFTAGSRIKGAGIPVGAYVTVVGSGTFTINTPATATATNVELYDARLKYTFSATSPIGINGKILFVGDEEVYNGSDTTVYTQVCTKAGVIAGSPGPVLRSVLFGGGGAGGAGGTVSNKQVAYGSVVDTLKGENSFQYNDTTNILSVDNIRAAAGSEGAPSISFQSYTNSGLSHDVDGLKINEGGVKALDIRASDIYVNRHLNSLNAGNIGSFAYPFNQLFINILRPQPGSASAPTYNFDDGVGNLTNTGLFGSTSILGFSVGGSEKMRLNGGELLINSTTDQGAYTLQNNGGLYQNGAVNLNIGGDATGDMYYRASGGALTRIGVGSNGDVLTITSGLPAWAPSGGSVSGSGTAGRVAYWNGASSLTSSANFLFNGSSLSVSTTNTQGQLNVGGNKDLTTSGAQSYFAPATYTDQVTAASGTASSYVINLFSSPTIAAANTNVNFPDIANVTIEKPTAGPNAILAKALALRVNGPINTAESVQRSYTGATTDITLNSTHDIVAASAASGNITVTLPSATGTNTGLTYTIKRTDNSGNTCTVAGTIDGATNYTLTAQYKYVTVVSNGTNWYIISNN